MMLDRPATSSPHRSFTALATGLAAALTAATAAHGQSWRVVDLGTLGGSGSSAYAINDSGAVVGEADRANGDRDAFLWTPLAPRSAIGSIQALPANWADRSVAMALNASGHVAGWTWAANSEDSSAFFGTATSTSIVQGTAPGFIAWLAANGLNGVGDIAGYAQTTSGVRPSVRQAGVTRILSLPSGAQSGKAVAINDNGFSVGASVMNTGATRATVWMGVGTIGIALGTFGGEQSEAKAVNNARQVVGIARNAQGQNRAFVWTATGGMVELPGLGGTESGALGINEAGEIVGYARTGAASGGTPANSLRACVWRPVQSGTTVSYTVQDLNARLPSGSNWRLMQAYAINSSGQIVGRARNAQGVVRAFLLTQDSVCIGDFNGDGEINSADLTAFLSTWFQSRGTGDMSGDFNGDGVVNSADITGFLSSWFEGRAGGC